MNEAPSKEHPNNLVISLYEEQEKLMRVKG